MLVSGQRNRFMLERSPPKISKVQSTGPWGKVWEREWRSGIDGEPTACIVEAFDKVLVKFPVSQKRCRQEKVWGKGCVRVKLVTTYQKFWPLWR